MGFFSIIDGDLKPSDEYLEVHKLQGYEVGDMDHDDYDINEDTVAISIIRICNKCGKPFTLGSAISKFDDYFKSEFFYMEEFVGQMCANCAIEEVESDFE